MTKNELIAENKWLRERAEKAEAELAALRRDARILADWCSLNGPEYTRRAAARVFEATKEEKASK